jgi:hypothetical protein
MDKLSLLRKGLAVGIVLLFVGVTVAPGINFSVVKASGEDNLMEVTTQICGIKGFEDTTVKLTRQQYQNLERYLVDFRGRVNTTTISDETVRLFKEAVIELNKYGLLPKKMRVEQAQKLIVGPYENSKGIAIVEKMFHEKTLVANQSNSFCFIAGIVHDGFVTGPLGILGTFISLFGLILHLNFIAKVGLLLMGVSNIITTISPISVLQRVDIHMGNITSVGLSGVKNFNISVETGGGIISGFTGIKITRNETSEINLLGVALSITG